MSGYRARTWPGGRSRPGGAGTSSPATAKQIRQRDRFFTILSHLPAKRLIRYVSARTATAIKLPEYPEPGSR
jgi:hypothetical protein